MKENNYQIKNDIDFEAMLITIGLIYYPYADPDARKRYDEMSEDEKNFYKKHLKGWDENDLCTCRLGQW